MTERKRGKERGQNEKQRRDIKAANALLRSAFRLDVKRPTTG